MKRINSIKNGALIVGLILLYTTKSFSQQYSAIQYNLHNGLPVSQVTSLALDSLGYLWIGTHGGGVSRFDGREFTELSTKHGLVNNYVTNLNFDTKGNLWIATLLGISRFDGASFYDINLNLAHDASPKEFMIMQIAQTKSSQYILNDAGRIGKIELDKVEWIPGIKPAKFIGIKNEELFYHTNGNELKSLLNKDLSISLPEGIALFSMLEYNGEVAFNSNKGLFTLVDNSFVKVLNEFSTGPLFIDQEDGLVWDANDRLVQCQLPNQAQGKKVFEHIFQITSCVIDDGGELWIGTYTQGLFHLKKRSFEKIFKPAFESMVIPIEKDKDDNFWFGYFGEGLTRWNRKSQRHLYFNDTKKNFVLALKRQGESLWIGTYGGLGLLRDNKIQWVKDDHGNDIEDIVSLDLDLSNRVWVGRKANKDIVLIEEEKIKYLPFGDNTAISLKYSEVDSSLYIGTFHGIQRYHNGSFEKLNIDNLKDGIVRSMDIIFQRFLVFTTEENGLILYDLVSRQTNRINEEDGLLSTLLFFVKAHDSDLWVGSVKGINRITLSRDLKILDVSSFNEKNGFDGIEANSNSVYLSEDFSLFGSLNTIYQFEGGIQPVNKVNNLHFQEVKLFYGEHESRLYADSLMGFFKLPINPDFPPSENHLTFKFNAVSKSASIKPKYSYLLENFEHKWSPLQEGNEVTFSSLPPGDYNFRVRMMDGTSRKVLEEVSYPFTIRTPIYKTAWFITAIILMIIGIALLLIRKGIKKRIQSHNRLNEARLEENQRLRQEIARDFHDEMGNHLAIISSHISYLLMDERESNKQDFLLKIEESIKYINLRTRDFIWSINPSNNNLEDLFLYLRDFANGLFHNSAITFRAENNISVNCSVSYKFSREIILIFKEVFTNAFKHSKALNVFFRLTTNQNSFHMEVLDDGTGVQKTNFVNGGLANLSYRAKKIGAGLTIDSQDNKGTRVGLRFNSQLTN